MIDEDRISSLERQVLILTAKVGARDVAITQMLKESLSITTKFIQQYPEMLAEIDRQVLSTLTEDAKKLGAL